MGWLGEAARPRVVRESPKAPWFAVGAVCIGAFMGQLDASIVTLAYRDMQQDFHQPLGAVQWVSLAYMLVIVAALTPVGWVSDARGRKRIYLYGFVLFTAGSAACGLAPSLGWLVAFRMVQATGAAMLSANSVAIVVGSLPEGKRRQALGVQAAAQALGLVTGPLAGGLLVASGGWRAVFWVNVPIGVLAVVAGHLLIPRTRELSSTGRFDWTGLGLLTGATTCLLLGLSGASGLGLPGPAVAALLAAAVSAAYGFWVRERRTKHALISEELLGSPPVMIGLLGAMCGYLVLFGPLVLIPHLLAADGIGPAHAGLLLASLPVGYALASLASDKVLPRGFGNRPRIVAGSVIAAGSLVLLAVRPADPGWIVPFLCVLGIGLGVFVPANNSAIVAKVPQRLSGTVGGLINMVRSLGTALGVAMVSLALHPTGHAATADQQAGRLAIALLVCAAVVITMTGLLIPGADGRLRSVPGRRRA